MTTPNEKPGDGVTGPSKFISTGAVGRLVWGHRGESAALELKKPWTEKESPGPPCPGLAVTRSPVFVARISFMRKMMKRGKIAATKWR
jgi:hypothetical protein